MCLHYLLRRFSIMTQSRCPHRHHISQALTSTLFCIGHTTTSSPLSHSHPFPLLCLNPHTCIHSPHTHIHTHSHTHTYTHTIITTIKTMLGKRWPWTCLAPPPHQSSGLTTNPQHTPPSLCMQAFPWQLWCGCACLATRRLSLPPILLIWCGGLQTVLDKDWLQTKDLTCISGCCCQGQSPKKGKPLQEHTWFFLFNLTCKHWHSFG